MKVSVIVSVFNNKGTISDAIQSIILQNYEHIECIVIDAGSTDGTVEVVKSFGNKINVFVSESDNGIYDGLNKGISLATGDVISFLHSDDVYDNKNVISNVVRLFSNDVQGVYGDLVYTHRADVKKVVRYWKSGIFSTPLLDKGWMPPHPTLFLRSGVYHQYGNFDSNYKIAGDYDFMLRILKAGVLVRYLPSVLYRMRMGGKSNRSIKNLLNKSKEDFRAMKKNGINRPYLALFYKNSSKIMQLIRR